MLLVVTSLLDMSCRRTYVRIHMHADFRGVKSGLLTKELRYF